MKRDDGLRFGEKGSGQEITNISAIVPRKV